MQENTSPETAPKKKRALKTIAVSAAVIVVASGILYYIRANSFCFDFVHDTQFGDKPGLENPSNEPFLGPSGMAYFIPETSALQTALVKEGFFVDEYERTGGGVYLTSFFGPSTKTAVMEFQKRYSLEPTGAVDNDTIDALRATYGCTAPVSQAEATATSTRE